MLAGLFHTFYNNLCFALFTNIFKKNLFYYNLRPNFAFSPERCCSFNDFRNLRPTCFRNTWLCFQLKMFRRNTELLLIEPLLEFICSFTFNSTFNSSDIKTIKTDTIKIICLLHKYILDIWYLCQIKNLTIQMHPKTWLFLFNLKIQFQFFFSKESVTKSSVDPRLTEVNEFFSLQIKKNNSTVHSCHVVLNFLLPKFF